MNKIKALFFLSLICSFTTFVYSGTLELEKIFEIIENDKFSSLEEMLNKSPTLINTKKNDWTNLLHHAVINNNNKITRLLLEKGIDPNEVKEGGVTPLHLAVFSNNIVGANLLMDYGANVHYKDTAGWNSIYIASAMGFKDIIEALKNNGAKEDIFTYAATGNIEKVKSVIKRDESLILPIKESGFSLLHIAATAGQLEIVKLLISKGSHLNHKTREGTPLILASLMGHSKIVNVLLDNNAEINLTDSNGMTALHWASSEGNFEIVKTLLDHNADSNKLTNNGLKPIDLAIQNKKANIIKILK
ncbi:MAG: ankyrin repeat domain-containing protein [bacterium]